MIVAILTRQLLNETGERPTLGGVQTYLWELARVCRDQGWEPRVYQFASREFQTTHEGVRISGVTVPRPMSRSAKRRLHQAACHKMIAGRDLLIFGSSNITVPTTDPRTIAIQHGVGWDVPWNNFRTPRWWEWNGVLQARRAISRWNVLRDLGNTANCVCVDYNFVNWLRTVLVTEPRQRLWTIPNFAPTTEGSTLPPRSSSAEPVRVLFARRFEAYRGTRLYVAAVREVLKHGVNARFTFAGEGPDEEWMRSQFRDDPRVTFTKFQANERLDVHRDHEIAVVPSLGSEGTSLSVAEGLAAGSAVLATAVGGITNMILSEYNGILVLPALEPLVEGLLRLIRDHKLRQELGARGMETAQTAFSLDRWRTQWREVLRKVAL